MNFLIKTVAFLSLVISNLCQNITLNPTDTFVKLNGNVLLKCYIEGYNSNEHFLEWCKNDFCTWGRLVESDSQNYYFKNLPKYFIKGKVYKGEWNLYIENVTDTEEGEYKCKLSNKFDGKEKSVKIIESSKATLKILHAPKILGLNLNYNVELTLNKSNIVTCNVQEELSNSKFKWIITNANKSQTFFENLFGKNENYQILKSVHSDEYSSQVKILGDFELDKKVLICIIEHPLLGESYSKPAKIEIKHPPILSMIYEPNETLVENKIYSFNCKSISNPISEQKSKIYMTNSHSKLAGNNGNLLLKLNRNMHGKNLTCYNTNSIGESYLNFSLDIKYEPKFLETLPAYIIVNETQKEVKLSCKVDANPDSLILWFKNFNQIVSIGDTLYLNNSNESSIQGEYTCKVKTDSFDDIYATTSILVNGKPSIFGKTDYIISGRNELRVEFQALSYPSFEVGPVCKKQQQNDEKNILDDKQKYFIESHNLLDNKISTRFSIVIRNVSSHSDPGIYNCSIKNSFGESHFSFRVFSKTNLVIHWIYFVVLVLVTFMFILLVTSPFYTKFKSKNRVKINFSVKKFINRLNEINEWNEILDKRTTLKNVSKKVKNPSSEFNNCPYF